MGDSDVNKNQTVALSGFTSCAFYFFFFPAQFLGYLCSSRFEICSMSFTLWHAEGTDASARSLTPSACERKQKGKSKTKKTKKKGEGKGYWVSGIHAHKKANECVEKKMCVACVYFHRHVQTVPVTLPSPASLPVLCVHRQGALVSARWISSTVGAPHRHFPPHSFLCFPGSTPTTSSPSNTGGVSPPHHLLRRSTDFQPRLTLKKAKNK